MPCIEAKNRLHDDEQVAVSCVTVDTFGVSFLNLAVDQFTEVLDVISLIEFQPQTIDLKIDEIIIFVKIIKIYFKLSFLQFQVLTSM